MLLNDIWNCEFGFIVDSQYLHKETLNLHLTNVHIVCGGSGVGETSYYP